MKNFEKFKTVGDRITAFTAFCEFMKLKKQCPCALSCAECQFAWLDIEAEEPSLPSGNGAEGRREVVEKIEDIVADIRQQNLGMPDDMECVSPLVCDMLRLADRIDLAYKRVIVENHRVQDAFDAKVAECDALHAENDRVVIVIKVFFFLLIVVLYLHVICKMIWG